MLLRCYGGELVLLTDITGGTGAMGGDAKGGDGTVRGPVCAMCVLGGVWIWEPRRGHSLSGCYTHLCPVLQAWAGTPPIPSSHHRSPLPG